MTTTIGQLTNVPTPGDPIRSDWTQDVTKLGIHVFASKAALDAQWGSADDGAHAHTTDTDSDWVRIGGVWRGEGTPTLGTGQNPIFGTYSGQPLTYRGWLQNMATDGSGDFVSTWPTGVTVNGCLTVQATYCGFPAPGLIIITAVGASNITGRAYDAVVGAAIVSTVVPVSFLALTW